MSGELYPTYIANVLAFCDDKVMTRWWQGDDKVVKRWWQGGEKVVARWWQGGDKVWQIDDKVVKGGDKVVIKWWQGDDKVVKRWRKDFQEYNYFAADPWHVAQQLRACHCNEPIYVHSKSWKSGYLPTYKWTTSTRWQGF